MADEQKRKKVKLASDDHEADRVQADIFHTFRKNKDDMNKLHFAYTAQTSGFQQANVCMLHVDEANARIGDSFMGASIQTSTFQPLVVFPSGEIFIKGLFVLRSYLLENKIPRDMQCRTALRKLLDFFTNETENFDALTDKGQERGEWAVRLSQHVLSKLAITDTYTVDQYLERPPAKIDYCLCQKKYQIICQTGDTSFGCPIGWHGPSDIMIDDSIPVTVRCDTDAATAGVSSFGDASSRCSSVSSSLEAKCSDSFSETDMMQIISQTIVMSFLQHKENKDKLNNSLIPGLGICPGKVVAFFYDSVEDVLLGTAPMKFLDMASRTFSRSCVVFLWLTLNFRYLCSGVPDEMKAFKANFFDRIGSDFLKVYREEVTRPLPRSEQKSNDSELWDGDCSSDCRVVTDTKIGHGKMDLVSLSTDCLLTD